MAKHDNQDKARTVKEVLDEAAREEEALMPWARRTVRLLAGRCLAQRSSLRWLWREVREVGTEDFLALLRAWREVVEELTGGLVKLEGVSIDVMEARDPGPDGVDTPFPDGCEVCWYPVPRTPKGSWIHVLARTPNPRRPAEMIQKWRACCGRCAGVLEQRRAVLEGFDSATRGAESEGAGQGSGPPGDPPPRIQPDPTIEHFHDVANGRDPDPPQDVTTSQRRSPQRKDDRSDLWECPKCGRKFTEYEMAERLLRRQPMLNCPHCYGTQLRKLPPKS